MAGIENLIVPVGTTKALLAQNEKNARLMEDFIEIVKKNMSVENPLSGKEFKEAISSLEESVRLGAADISVKITELNAQMSSVNRATGTNYTEFPQVSPFDIKIRDTGALLYNLKLLKVAATQAGLLSSGQLEVDRFIKSQNISGLTEEQLSSIIEQATTRQAQRPFTPPTNSAERLNILGINPNAPQPPTLDSDPEQRPESEDLGLGPISIEDNIEIAVDLLSQIERLLEERVPLNNITPDDLDDTSTVPDSDTNSDTSSEEESKLLLIAEEILETLKGMNSGNSNDSEDQEDQEDVTINERTRDRENSEREKDRKESLKDRLAQMNIWGAIKTKVDEIGKFLWDNKFTVAMLVSSLFSQEGRAQWMNLFKSLWLMFKAGMGELFGFKAGEGSFWSLFTKNLVGALLDLFHWTSNLAMKAATWIGKQLIAAVSWLDNQIQEGIRYLWDKLKESLSWLGDKLGESLSWVVDSVSGLGLDLKTYFTNLADRIITGLEIWITWLGNKVDESLAWLGKELKKSFIDLKNVFSVSYTDAQAKSDKAKLEEEYAKKLEADRKEIEKKQKDLDERLALRIKEAEDTKKGWSAEREASRKQNEADREASRKQNEADREENAKIDEAQRTAMLENVDEARQKAVSLWDKGMETAKQSVDGLFDKWVESTKLSSSEQQAQISKTEASASRANAAFDAEDKASIFAANRERVEKVEESINRTDKASSGKYTTPSPQSDALITEGVNMKGLNPEFSSALSSAATDFEKETGLKLKVNSAFRTPSEQDALRKTKGGYAAKGTSPHEVGIAVDITPVGKGAKRFSDDEKLHSTWLSIASKYGIFQPLDGKHGATKLNEPWHYELNVGQGMAGAPQRAKVISSMLGEKSQQTAVATADPQDEPETVAEITAPAVAALSAQQAESFSPSGANASEVNKALQGANNSKSVLETKAMVRAEIPEESAASKKGDETTNNTVVQSPTVINNFTLGSDPNSKLS